MRIWITGGGTGGHVYPGLAVAQALAVFAGEGVEIRYVGGAGGVEEQLAARAGLPFTGVPAGGLHGLGPRRAMQNLLRLCAGCWRAYRLGCRERPAAVFATGGYASVPVSLAAWALRTPILVYLPDIEPGWAVRFIGRLATRVAVTVEEARAHFPARKVIVTGYPLRAEFHAIRRPAARAALGLPPDEPAVLVMGGSRGASGLNRPVGAQLETLLALAHIIHISGELDWPRVQAQRDALPPARRERYHAFPYLHEMEQALAAADLAVCRAGASVLGELPFFGLPALLVPYPHAWRYQRVNAGWLAGRGAALVLEESRLGEELGPTLRRLLSDPAALQEMATRMRALSRPDAAKRLAAELSEIAR